MFKNNREEFFIVLRNESGKKVIKEGKKEKKGKVLKQKKRGKTIKIKGEYGKIQVAILE